MLKTETLPQKGADHRTIGILFFAECVHGQLPVAAALGILLSIAIWIYANGPEKRILKIFKKLLQLQNNGAILKPSKEKTTNYLLNRYNKRECETNRLTKTGGKSTRSVY